MQPGLPGQFWFNTSCPRDIITSDSFHFQDTSLEDKSCGCATYSILFPAIWASSGMTRGSTVCG